MKCYLIKTNDGELKLMQVKPSLEAAFMADYAGQILVAGDSIQEVLIKFSALGKNG